jgi:hypothetical protein
MINIRTLTITALGLVLSTHAPQAQDRSRYRDFLLGGDLQSVAALTKMASSSVKTLHLRPAVIQELEWRPADFVSGLAVSHDDPVRQIVFSFYDDQLSRMVVDYDRDRTAGLTEADMIAAISKAYGPSLPTTKRTQTVVTQIDDESGPPVARWGDADYAVVLYRSSYPSGFKMIVTSPRLEALSRIAAAEAIRLDQREAPRRELARQKKEEENARIADEKARATNKAAFRP